MTVKETAEQLATAEPAEPPDDAVRLARYMQPAQLAQLGDVTRGLARGLLADLDASTTPRRRRLRSGTAHVLSFLGELAAVAGRLQQQSPGNWRTWASFFHLKPLIGDGFSVLWVPDADTLEAMRQQPDRDTRQHVLLDRREEVLDHACSVLDEVTDPSLQFDREVVRQALACVTGFPYPAQVTALVVATNRARVEIDALKSKDFGNAGPVQKTVLDTVENLGESLIVACMKLALSRFFPDQSDPIPTTPNRHAAVHAISAEQYTPGNALESVLLAVSVLRQTQSNRDALAKQS